MCRVCFGERGGLGTGAHGCCLSLQHPEKTGVCARGHPWHNPVHAVGGRDIRPGPQRHSARRAGFLMRCCVPCCANPRCTFAHSDIELKHWRQHLPVSSVQQFHPRVEDLLSQVGVKLPVTENIREKINALDLGTVLHRLMRLKLDHKRGFAALLEALKQPTADTSLLVVQPVLALLAPRPQACAPQHPAAQDDAGWDPMVWRQWEESMGCARQGSV